MIGCLFTIASAAQSISPDVVAGSGAYYSKPAGSLSWTLGELSTETYTAGNNTLTQGFQQPVIGIIISGIDLDLLVYLEGPFNGMDMNTDLNGLPDFRLTQPYNISPWNYSGSESVMTLPNPGIVDWVLVELRDATDAVSAHPGTTIAMQAAFLLSDGSVVGMDGSSILAFNHSIIHTLFVVVWHRNHLGIMSAYGVTETGGVYSYDFSTAEDRVYGDDLGHKELDAGVWGMIAGDGDSNWEVTSTDKDEWATKAGFSGYFLTDYSLNGQVDNRDKNDILIDNIYSATQVPD